MARRTRSIGVSNRTQTSPCVTFPSPLERARPSPVAWLRWMLLALIIQGLCGVSLGGDVGNVRVSSSHPAHPVEIPFRAYQDYLIVVDGRLGSLTHQNLLLDTGSNPSLIDRSVAAKLGLQGTSQDLTLFNKSVASQYTTLPDLQFGPVRRQNLPTMVADLSTISRSLGTRLDAVIGLDVLGASSFTVDYAKHRIFFGASSERHSAPFSAGPQFITVDLKSGARQLHLLLDTGTPRLVLFDSHLRGVDYEWADSIGTGQNVSGTIGFKAIVLSEAKLGTLDVGPQRASVVTRQQGPESDLDGLMGLSCLHPRRISFDFERQLLGWTD